MGGRSLFLAAILFAASFPLRGEGEERAEAATSLVQLKTHHRQAAQQQERSDTDSPLYKGRCLNFIHIPKTAGTSIEAQGGLVAKWGREADLHCSTEHYCPWSPAPGKGEGFLQMLRRKAKKQSAPRSALCCRLPGNQICSAWHTPPSTDDVLAKVYSQCETFCVVRHPLERFISELRYRYGKPPNTPEFVEYTRGVLERLRSNPYTADCHLVPQVQYVFGQANESASSPYCQHVLRMENLTDGFNALMKEFSLPLELTEHSNVNSDSAVTIPDDVRKEITDYYASDFDAFGYQPGQTTE